MAYDPNQPDPNSFAPWAPQQGQGQMPGGMDPSVVQAVIALNGQQAAQQKAMQQMKMADAMRQDAQGQTKGTQAGRVYKAPGWGNALAGVANSLAAGYSQNQGQKTLDTANADAQKGLTSFYNEWKKNQDLLRAGMGRTPGAAPAAAPADATPYPMGSGY